MALGREEAERPVPDGGRREQEAERPVPAPCTVGFAATTEAWDAATFIDHCRIDSAQQRALQLPSWRLGAEHDEGGASVPLVDDTPDEYLLFASQPAASSHQVCGVPPPPDWESLAASPTGAQATTRP